MSPKPDWNLTMVRAPQALDLIRSADGTIDWQDVRVCQLDTGYTEHPIFVDRADGRTWILAEQGLNVLEPGTLPLDLLNYEGSTGHGSRVASIICGDASGLAENDATIVGVAPCLPLVPCRVTNSVLLTSVDRRDAVGAGIRHAIAIECPIVSISLGTPGFPANSLGDMGAAVDAAYENGVIVVAAGGQVIESVTYPGKYKRTIACGGLTWQQRTWPSYNHTIDSIDVWAPAVDVARADAHSTDRTDSVEPSEGEDPGSFSPTGVIRWVKSAKSSSSGESLSPEGKLVFGKGEGTSYATAHVAAAAAMWLRFHGTAIDRRYGKSWQRVEAFRSLLKSSANSVFGARRMPNGSGRLSIENLLGARLPDPATLTMAGPDKDMRW